MKLYGFLLLLICCGYAWGNVVRNTRLVDHASYMIEVISKTMNAIEQRGWCNFKVPDYVQEFNEHVISAQVIGTARFTNGFVSSIQHVDIQQATVQQIWSHNATANLTTVNVQGTMRMHDVSIGYDVIADFQDGRHHYTTVYVHPLISFAFNIIKDLNSDNLQVRVVGSVPNSSRTPVFKPVDTTTDVLTLMFNQANTAAGILAWGPEIFEPILLEVVTKEVEFPTICFNCPV